MQKTTMDDGEIVFLVDDGETDVVWNENELNEMIDPWVVGLYRRRYYQWHGGRRSCVARL